MSHWNFRWYIKSNLTLLLEQCDRPLLQKQVTPMQFWSLIVTGWATSPMHPHWGHRLQNWEGRSGLITINQLTYAVLLQTQYKS